MKNVLKIINKAMRQNKYEIALIALVIIAAFLRIYKQEEYIDFFGDVGRDMIIAKHVAEDMEWTETRPYAATTPYLNNSMFYFNFLGVLWFLFPSILSINMFHTIISLSAIILGYLIGKELVDKNVGIVIAAYFTFSFYFISIARFIWQPNLIPYFFLAGLYFFIKSFYDQKLQYIYISILLFFICLNIHYSTLLVIPAISIWILKRHSEIVNKNKENRVVNWLIFSTYLYLLFIIWIKLVDLKIKSIIQILLNSQSTLSLKEFIYHGIETMVLFSKFLYGNHNYSLLLYLIFLIAIIFSLINKKIKVSKLIAFIYSLNFSIIIAFFLKENIYIHYYGQLLITAYISSAILINKLVKIKLLRFLMIIFLFILFLHSTANDNKLIGATTYFEKWERLDYDNAKEISKEIINDYQKISNTKNTLFHVRINEYGVQYPSSVGQYYIFLEKITNKRLLDITRKHMSYNFVAGDNLEIIEKRPNLIYIICYHFPYNSNIPGECINPLLKSITIIGNDTHNIEKIKEITHYKKYTSLYRLTPK
jgi:hypothetical protein